VAVSPASKALIESIIQINKAYKCAFFSMKMLLNLKFPGLPPDPVGELSALPQTPYS